MTLIVVGCQDIHAEEVYFQVWRLQCHYLLDLEDAVFVVKDDKGKVQLHQTFNLRSAGAIT